MSESLEHQEGLPSMNLRLENDEILVANPENATLFTHMGRLAMYDHVFVTRSVSDGTHSGLYVFAEFMRETFDGMQTHMLENEYPAFINRRDVPDCDIRAFDDVVEQHAANEGDFIPEGWE